MKKETLFISTLVFFLVLSCNKAEKIEPGLIKSESSTYNNSNLKSISSNNSVINTKRALDSLTKKYSIDTDLINFVHLNVSNNEKYVKKQ